MTAAAPHRPPSASEQIEPIVQTLVVHEYLLPDFFKALCKNYAREYASDPNINKTLRDDAMATTFDRYVDEVRARVSYHNIGNGYLCFSTMPLARTILTTEELTIIQAAEAGALSKVDDRCFEMIVAAGGLTEQSQHNLSGTQQFYKTVYLGYKNQENAALMQRKIELRHSLG